MICIQVTVGEASLNTGLPKEMAMQDGSYQGARQLLCVCYLYYLRTIPREEKPLLHCGYTLVLMCYWQFVELFTSIFIIN